MRDDSELSRNSSMVLSFFALRVDRFGVGSGFLAVTENVGMSGDFLAALRIFGGAGEVSLSLEEST